jgi:N-acetyl-anhydromuramoyl-L-alanine amidase
VKINARTGLIEGITYHPSPHCDARPSDSTISLLVVHGISLPPGAFGTDSVHRLFMNQLTNNDPLNAHLVGVKVSAHAFIRRDGQVIQYVPFPERAWHAGISSFQGRSQCNNFSIGIELEGTDEICYEIRQYEQLALLATELMRLYPAITLERIVGHVDIAPGRKTDPGPAFDWSLLFSLIDK